MAILDVGDPEAPVRVVTDGTWEIARTPVTDFHLKDSPVQKLVQGGELRPAWAFDGVWGEPWGMPTNGPHDLARMNGGTHRIEEEVLGTVVEKADGLGAWEAVEGGKPVAARPFYRSAPDDPPIAWSPLRGMYHLVREDVFQRFSAWIDEHEARSPKVVYDAGAETHGRIRLRNAGEKKCWVVVGLGESRGEMDKYNRRFGELLPIAPGETVTTKTCGFRYAKVIVLAGEGTVRLDPPIVEHVLYDVEPKGSFACSDEWLTKIWAVSAHTLHLCMQAQIWDGARRDLMPWMGDLHPEALTAYHAFGAWDAVKTSLRDVRELGPDPVPPLTESPMAGLRHLWKGNDINGIPSYTAWWAVSLHDYWRYTGDLAFVKDHAASLQGVLGQVASRVDRDGRWTPPGKEWGANYVDWSNLAYDEAQAAMQVLGIVALTKGADLLERSGSAEPAEYRKVAERMKGFLAERLLDPARGVIVSPRHQPNALAVENGLLDPAQARAVFRNSVAKPMEIFFTPWWRWHDLEAAAAVGEIGWGLGEIRGIWGGMLEAGATSFWESFDRSYLKAPDPHAVTLTTETIQGYGGYRTSLCHGWSSGPAVWLHTAVLGVTPVADGFAKFRFNPALGDLEWAEGVVPTPKGAIRIRIEKLGANGMKGTIEIPPGVEGETSIPGLVLKGEGVKTFEKP